MLDGPAALQDLVVARAAHEDDARVALGDAPQDRVAPLEAFVVFAPQRRSQRGRRTGLQADLVWYSSRQPSLAGVAVQGRQPLGGVRVAVEDGRPGPLGSP